MTIDRSKKWAILFAVVATQFAVPFMISSVGISLPSIGREFQASAVALSLVEGVFLCGNAMLLLPLGRAADILGRAGIFLSGLVIFLLGTFTLTLAPTMGVFLLIRGVQSVGGAMTLATGVALLYDAFPVEERGRALGISMAGVFLGISAGPFLGGMIISHLGWRWLFYLGMLPLAMSVLACMRNLDWRLSWKSGERFDWVGTVVSGLGICLVVLGSAHAENATGWWTMAAGCLTLLLFLFVESRVAAPLIELELFFGNRTFALGVLSLFITSFPAFSVPFLLSLYLQFSRGMTPAEAGAIMVLQPLMQSLVSPMSGRMADKVPAHIMAGCGALISVIGVWVASTLTVDSGLVTISIVLCVVGLGVGLFSAPSMVVVMSSVGPSRYGIASAMSGQARTFGMTICMTVMTVGISLYVGAQPLGPAVVQEFGNAMRALYTVFGVLGVIGVTCSFLAKQHRVPDKSRKVTSS